MPKNYKVQTNDTLFKIAKDNDFFSISPLLLANQEIWPNLCDHPGALMEGMTIVIPDKKPKAVEQQTGTNASYICSKSAKQYFQLKIRDYFGEIKSVKDDVQLIINGGAVPFQDITNYDLKPVEYKEIKTINPLPDGKISNSSLKVITTSAINGKKNNIEIKLEIGGADPFIDPTVKGYSGKQSSHNSLIKALQKALLTLGLYDGDIDGDVAKSDTVTAVMRFQRDYMKMEPENEDFGLPTPGTCAILGIALGNYLGPNVQPIKYD